MLLELDSVSVMTRSLEILKSVSLNVRESEVVSLLGGNASGKTTTLKTILGMMKIVNGEIRFDGAKITHHSARRSVTLGIAIVPENRRLFPDLTVKENLLLVLENSGPDSSSDHLARVAERFPFLSEQRRWNQRAGSLSGGEQQQVAMARALLQKPRLMLLDEPSMGLSVKLAKDMIAMIRSIATSGVGILMVEQNVKMALDMSDRAYVLQEGRIILEGDSAKLLGSELIQRSYLGEFVD